MLLAYILKQILYDVTIVCLELLELRVMVQTVHLVNFNSFFFLIFQLINEIYLVRSNDSRQAKKMAKTH